MNSASELVRQCAKAGQVDRAWAAWQKLDSAAVDAESCQCLLTACCKAEDLRKAHEVFNFAEREELQLDNSTLHDFALAISHSCRTHIPGEATVLQLVQLIRKRGLVLQGSMGSAAVSECAKSSLPLAFGLFAEFKDACCELSGTALNTLVHSAAAHPEHVEATVAVYQHMRAQHIQVSDVVYSSLCSLCTRAGKPAEAWRIFEHASQAGVSLDDATCNGVVYACAEVGDADAAWGAYSLLKAESIRTNQVTCTSLINALADAAKNTEAITVLHDMQAAGQSPDTVIYNAVLHGCAKAADRDRAIKLIQDMHTQGVALDEVTYSTALHACATSGDLPAALGVFHTMQAAGVAPNERCYGALIHACALAKDAAQAQAIFDQLLSTGQYVGEVSYASLVHAYANACDADGALRALKDMALTGLPPNAQAFNAAINACAKAKPCHKMRVEQAFGLAQEMHARGCRTDTFTFTALLKACAANKNITAAEEVFENMMRAHRVLPNAYVYRAYASVFRRCGMKQRAVEVEALLKEDTDASRRGPRQGANHLKKAEKKKMPPRARMCKFFMSAQGCRNGESCPFLHDVPEHADTAEVWAMISGYVER